MGQDRRQVARHVHSASAVGDDDAAGVGDPGRDDDAGLRPPQGDDRRRALELAQRTARRRLEVQTLPDAFSYEVGYDLGVGLGAEAAAALDQAGAELAVVLDDTVVDETMSPATSV